MKYLGLDWGEKRIGLALADSETKMALPFKIVANLTELLKVIKEEKADKIIVGHPLKMKDVKLKVDARFSEFLKLLKSKTKLPLELIDERLSSLEGDKLFGDKKNKASRDELAAMIILQNYLDHK